MTVDAQNLSETKESETSQGKNDKAWELLFNDSKIGLLSKVNGTDNWCRITAEQISQIGKREPRLMTKFDHKVNLPQLFKQHRLSVLPVTRGDYLVGRFDAYGTLGPDSVKTNPLQKFDIPSHLETLRPEFISSEAMAINCACASGILGDFIGDGELYSTVNGRMTSDQLEYDIDVFLDEDERSNKKKTKNVIVRNSQMEIDAGYESDGNLTIIEAKRDLADDFLVRQLFYPYCKWKKAISKKIRTVFLVYSDSVFHLYEYGFSDDYYNSFKLLRYQKYSAQLDISRNDISEIAYAAEPVEEPKIPFPQANSMERIVNLLELLYDHAMTRDEITGNYAFTGRQTSYYTDAGRYLGLIDKKTDSDANIEYCLTDQGQKIMSMRPTDRQIAIIGQIFSHRVFKESYLKSAKLDPLKDKDDIEKIILDSMKDSIYNITSRATYERRASTIKKWLEWIRSKQDE